MKIITFGFMWGQLPAEADVVVDCRFLADADTTRPLAQEKLAEARRHIAPDAIIAFGCGFGEQRSVALARRLAEEAETRGITVDLEQRRPAPIELP